MQRISTGIQGLDDMIGGVPQNRSYLIAGEPGTGKTIMGLQFLLEGVRLGQKGIYVSIDEKPEHIIEDAKALQWDIESALQNGMLQFLDVSAYFASTRLGKKEGLMSHQIIDDLKEHIRNHQAKRLVVDPISPMVYHTDSVLEVTEYIRKLVFALEDDALECTSFLTSHIPVGSSQLGQYGIEEFMASGVIVLKLIKPQSKHVRTLFVRKMRCTMVDLTEYIFDIIPKRGIVLRQAI